MTATEQARSTGRTADDEPGRRDRLERRLQDYHGVGVADVLEMIAYLREDGDTVIAGGSLAWDLGNRLSDFDVVVCGPGTTPSRVPLQHWVKSLRVDAWTRSCAGVDRLFGHAAAALEGESPFEGAFGTTEEEQQLKLLHRMAFGLRIDGPPLRPATSRHHLDIARDLLVREYAERMRESILMASLGVRAGRLLAAAANARLAVEECLHTVLALRGVPFTGDKWLRERLQAVAPDLRARHDRFRALPPHDDERAVAAFVADAAALCGRLTGLDLTVAALSTDLSWSIGEVRMHSAGGDHYLLAPSVGTLWRLETAEAGVWRDLADRAGAGTGPAGAGTGRAGDQARPGPAGTAIRAGECTDAETALLYDLYARGLGAVVWNRGIPVPELIGRTEEAGMATEEGTGA